MIYIYTHVYFSSYKVYKNTHYDCFIRTLFLEVTNPNQTQSGNYIYIYNIHIYI